MKKIQEEIQSHFDQKIIACKLFGSGDCNIAYRVKTKDGKTFIVKKRKENPESIEQNSLFTEGRLLQFLFEKNLPITIPEIIFTSKYPDMYGYKYIEGLTLRKVWSNLDENIKQKICIKLGEFHASLSSSLSKEECQKYGLKIDLSTDLHPETLEYLKSVSNNPAIPKEIKIMIKEIKSMLKSTSSKAHFHFLHNDAHHENILIHNNEISGFFDFGDAEYGEVAKEFSRYIRDFPEYYEYIITSYEQASKNKLSRKRLIAYSFLSGLKENIKMLKMGDKKKQAISNIEWYKNSLHSLV